MEQPLILFSARPYLTLASLAHLQGTNPTSLGRIRSFLILVWQVYDVSHYIITTLWLQQSNQTWADMILCRPAFASPEHSRILLLIILILWSRF